MTSAPETRLIQASTLDDGTFLEIVLDAPKGNVLSMAMMDQIRAALAEHAGDPGLKAVMLRGGGGVFSFGASVPEHQSERAPAMLAAFHALVRQVVAYPAPIVALVEGRCLGGAFELVLASHAVLATEDAVFACPEVKLGVFPPVLAALGHLRLGAATAERLVFTGAELSARRAYDQGLVAEIAPKDAASVREWGLGWVRRTFGGLSAFAIREAVYAARAGSGLLAAAHRPLDALEARYLERILPSHDGNEGIAAFLEKRTPRWRDA